MTCLPSGRVLFLQRSRTVGLCSLIAGLTTVALCGCASLRIKSCAQKKLSRAEWRTAESLSNYTMGILLQGESSSNSLQKATEYLDRAIRTDPKCGRAYSQLFATYFHMGQDEKAVKTLDKAVGKNDATPYAQLAYQLGKQLIEEDEGHRSIPYFRFVLRHHDAEPLGLALSLGELYESIDIPEEAAHYFSESIRRCPTNSLAYLKLSDAYVALDKTDTAISVLKKASRRLPDDQDILYALGFTYSYNGDFKKAVPVYEAILADASKTEYLHPLFYLNIGEAYERTHRYREAEIVFEKCIKLYPQTHEALNYLAYMWAERGINLEQALEYSLRSLALRPKEPAYLDTLGWLYFKLKRYPEAFNETSKAHAMEPDDPIIADHLGDVHMAMNNSKQAVQCWIKSLMMDPSNKTVAHKLKRHGVDPKKIISRVKD